MGPLLPAKGGGWEWKIAFEAKSKMFSEVKLPPLGASLLGGIVHLFA